MGTRLNRLAEAVLTSTHNLCIEQKYEKYQNFYLKIFIFFFMVKFSIYLNRRVFVMFCFIAIYITLTRLCESVQYDLSTIATFSKS